MRSLKVCSVLAGIIGIMLYIPALSYAYTSLHGDFGPSSTNNGSIGVQYPGRLAGGQSLTQFRVLVPPGATRLSLQITVQNYSNLFTVARLKNPPSNIGTPPYDPGTGYSFAKLETEMCYASTIGGGINIANDAWSTPLSVNRAGWLYVDIVGGDVVYWIKYQVYFDKTTYDAWYSQIQWSQVEAGNLVPGGTTNPCSGVVCDTGESCVNGQCVCNSNCTGSYQCVNNQCYQLYTCSSGQYCPATNAVGPTTCTQQCQNYTTCPTGYTCNGTTLSNGGCTGTCNSGSPYTCSSGQYCPATNAVGPTTCTQQCGSYTFCSTGYTCNGTTLSNGGCTGTCILNSGGCSNCNPWQTCSNGNCVYPTNYEAVEWIVPVASVGKGMKVVQLNSSLSPPKNSPYFMLNPFLQFASLTGSYDFYAVISDYTGMYVARTDRIGNIAFIRQIQGDKIRSYQTLAFQNGWTLNSWSFGDVFEDLMRELRLSQQGCLDGNYRFYVGVAPAGTDISTQAGAASLYAVELYCNQP